MAKYIVTLVVETEEPVIKKRLKAFLLRALGMSADPAIFQSDLHHIDAVTKEIRVRAIDLD